MMKKVVIEVFLITLCTVISYHFGKGVVEREWAVEKAVYEKELELAIHRLGQADKRLQSTQVEFTKRLEEREQTHEKAMAVITRHHAQQLLHSNERAARYHELSKDSAESRVCLAEHTGRLDGSLTEGRQVVEELREYAFEWKSRLDLCIAEREEVRKTLNEH